LEKPFVLAERCELGQLALRANQDTARVWALPWPVFAYALEN
jgi:hypothetical protein